MYRDIFILICNVQWQDFNLLKCLSSNNLFAVLQIRTAIFRLLFTSKANASLLLTCSLIIRLSPRSSAPLFGRVYQPTQAFSLTSKLVTMPLLLDICTLVFGTMNSGISLNEVVQLVNIHSNDIDLLKRFISFYKVALQPTRS